MYNNIKVCQECGRKYIARSFFQKFCLKCKLKINIRKIQEKKYSKICPNCNSRFKSNNRRQRFCSVFCSKVYKEHLLFTCKKCGNNFHSVSPKKICPECKEEIRKYSKYIPKSSEKGKKNNSIFTVNDFCPVCNERKFPYKNTCGGYYCISTWNNSSEKEKKKLLKKVEAYAKRQSKNPKSSSPREPIEIFSDKS